MKKIDFFKKNINYILILITLSIACFMYWNYLIGHYATETYGIANNYQSAANGMYLPDGRLFSFIFFSIIGKLNMPILTTVSISVFTAIIFAIISVFELKKQITELIDLKLSQEIIVWIICSNIIFNFMFVEIMYFTEACILALSILFYLIASKYFIKEKYISSFIFLLMGTFCYQGTIGFFIVCSATFLIIKYKKINKKCLCNIIKIGLILLIAGILNLLFIKVITNYFNIKQNKQFSFNINMIVRNVSMILERIDDILKENCGLFPKNLMLVFVEILVFFSLYISIYEKRNRITNLLILIIITIASSCMIFLIQTGSFYTGRVHYCIGSLIGILLLYLYCESEIKETKINNAVFIIIITIYSIINFANTVQLVVEHQKVNKLEKEECIKIQEMITSYEKVNNIKVTKVVPLICVNNIEKGWFSQIQRKAVITYNNIRHYWGYAGVLNYYLETKLKTVQANEEMEMQYTNFIKNNNLEEGSIVCIGDTLYCMQYII